MISLSQVGYSRQVDLLLDYLVLNGSITGMDAIRIGIMNYKGRIYDLRKLGYTIVTEYETSKNSKGETKRYARYHLKTGRENKNA